MTARDRALGALYGLAVGDALGMPTQALPRDVGGAAVRRRWTASAPARRRTSSAPACPRATPPTTPTRP